ncbi:FadR/GntR family transcriptional regulator [Microbacterium marinilacus]|uniref:FadR/GntR family transcriptional regulator n=1 Tax=Microbacterium marinilacus TaxID=415209 RepID=A0ABP7BU54_9MICO|nr:FadR/GntR family transcriptional regulator [Microbacterium marinilacus]MBY0689095.1 FadR family transcriptional regulator [Microbacterium marinilacus]
MAVTDEAILKIKGMIVSGELGPGDRLPPEKELSDKLGLSRSSLREAVKALEVIRVLDVRRGDGTYVTSLQPQLLLEAMSFVVDLHQDDSILEILAVRRILEPKAAALASGAIADDQLDGIEALIAALEDDADIEGLVAHDIEFHSRIAQSSGNAYLANLIDSLSSHTVRARVWRGITQGGSVERTLDEHRAIVQALRQRDGELAEALMIAHVSGVEHWLRKAR